MNLDIAGLEHGGFRVTPMRSGNLLVRVRYCGFMENVSTSYLYPFLKLMMTASAAGAGKSVIWYDGLSIVRVCRLILFGSSAIIDDIRTLQKSGLASLGFFYCDFKDDQKKDRRGLLSSLLVQLGGQSDAYSAILSKFYEDHRRSFKQSYASDSELADCLKDML